MFSARVFRDGEAPIDILPIVDTVHFSTAAVGGFGACGFELSARDGKRVPHGADVKVAWNDRPLWEGRVEDKGLKIAGNEARYSLDCFGHSRILEETSVRRIWSLRSIPWRPAMPASGFAQCNSTTPALSTDTMFTTVGQFDPADLSRVGVNVDNYSNLGSAGDCNWAIYIAPEGMTLRKFYGTCASYGTTPRGMLQDSPDGSTWTSLYCATPSIYPGDDLAIDMSSDARFLMAGSMATASSFRVSFEDIRLLGTVVDEDVPGGFYGGTLLRDLIDQVPGLVAGIIEGGEEFVMASLSRTVRDAAVSVVQEVSAFYDREWAVWGDKRFDWKAVSPDAPHWIIPVGSCSEIDVSSTLDGISRTFYLVYENAATGEPEEQVVESDDPRNPYVRQDKVSDAIVSAPTVMTAASATRLAERIRNDRGTAPLARGRIVLPAMTRVQGYGVEPGPAMLIRGGQTIVLPDLPVDDYFRPTPGRDGATMFHVRSTECDISKGTITLELDAFQHRSDIMLARISAVTRTVTGG